MVPEVEGVDLPCGVGQSEKGTKIGKVLGLTEEAVEEDYRGVGERWGRGMER